MNWISWLRRRLTGLSATTSSPVSSGERPLVLLAGVGPTQILLAESVRSAWSDACAVVWLESMSNSPTDELRRVASELNPTRAISVGLEAVLAARNAFPELPIEGMFLHHELDFRFSNTRRQERLLEAFEASERLWFDSTVAMDKAAAHGSRRPHVLIPIPTFPNPASRRPASANVAVVTSHDELTNSEQLTIEALQSAVSGAGGQVSVHHVDQLYTKHDLAAGRSWDATVALNFPNELSCLVLVGKSGHHLFALAGLRSTTAQIYVDGTIENTAIAQRLRLNQHYIARGVALVERLSDEVRSWDPTASPCIPAEYNDGFRPAFESTVTRELPVWHEEGILEAGTSHFDLFFSVAAIENRSNGARPQRIRAMSLAFEDPGVPLVRMTANQNLLDRRMRGALALTRTGARPRFGYGENSTAPMPVEARGLLESGLHELRSAGLKFGWFVRDLHSLDPDSTVSQTRSDIDQLRKASISEFIAICETADVLFAPSQRASQLYARLLRSHVDHLPVRWEPLPPGIDSANCIASVPTVQSAIGSGHSEGIQIVYAGGLGGVYDLRRAISAIAGLNSQWNLQLVVRAEDLELAHSLTSSLPGQQVQIVNGEFPDIPLAPRPALGLALLDSDYGRASFPLKVMSYLERRLPVLVYRDSSPADLIQFYSSGAIVDETPESFEAGIEAAMSSADTVDWHSLHLKESWRARAGSVRDALRTSPRR